MYPGLVKLSRINEGLKEESAIRFVVRGENRKTAAVQANNLRNLVQRLSCGWLDGDCPLCVWFLGHGFTTSTYLCVPLALNVPLGPDGRGDLNGSMQHEP